MVVPKTSRKNKKAWRRNIDTEEVEHALQTRTEEERQGTAVSALSDQQLFFVDTAGNQDATVPTVTKLRRRPKEKKLLRCQVILQAAHLAKPVGTPQTMKKRHAAPKAPHSGAGAVQEVMEADARDAPLGDPWNANTAGSSGREWDEMVEYQKPGLKKLIQSRVTPRPLIAPVEVDKPGCSLNPEPEQHQDALAEAVAAEMKSIYAKDFQHKAPPARVDYTPETDELLLLQVDEEVDEEGEGDDGMEGDLRKHKRAERKTQKDLNRQKRRRAAEAEAAARQALKKQRRELDGLKTLEKEIHQDLSEKERNKRRREAIKAEKERTLPPRLGKHSFTPEPLQVLLSEEVSGSLRKLRPTPTMVRERYKSLQKRGLVEPRKKVLKKKGKRVSFIQGDRKDRVVEGMEEVRAMVAKRKKMKKKAKK